MSPSEILSSHDRPLHIMTSFFHLLGCTLLGFCIAKRTPRKWSEWRDLGWGRTCMILLLADSWIFVFLSGFITTGVSTFQDPVACSVTVIFCVTFQGSSKALICAYLVEKVYIVWSDGYRTPRLQTNSYKICLLFQLGYGAIFVMFLCGRSSYITGDGICFLGYKDYASISLIVYDFLQNIFFTVMFCWPLHKSKLISPALRAVAKRTLIGAIAGLLIIAVNVSMIIAMGGHQVVWVCMTSCTLDVLLNALIVYWVSSGVSSDSIDHFTLPTVNMVTRNDLSMHDSEGNNTVTSGEVTVDTLTTMASLRTTDHSSTQRSADLAAAE